MNKTILLLGALAMGCGDDGGNPGGTECGAGTTEVDGECLSDSVCGAGTVLTDGMCLPDGSTPPKVFVQVEHLGRPGINEALLFTDGFNAGYNATAPLFTGVPPAVLDQVVGEAKTVLKALYLSSCLISGVLPGGLTPGAGGTALKPGLVPCAEVGGNIFTNGNPLTGTTLTAATAAQAQVYADRMFDQFVRDTMRIDTSVASSYLTVCMDPTARAPLLCGGRRLDDDVIDVTYDYLIGGLAGRNVAGPGPQDSNPGNNAFVLTDQVRALTSDGVSFDRAAGGGAGANKLGITDGVPGNPNQGHNPVSTDFPYSAVPF